MVHATLVSILALFLLVACGGGSDGGSTRSPDPRPAENLPFPPDAFQVGGARCLAGCFGYRTIPDQTATDAKQMPTHVHPNAHRIDVGVAQSQIRPDQLPVVGKRGEFDIRHGRLDDGAGKVGLANYFDDALGVHPRLDSAPVVRFGGPATQEDISRLVQAVQLINTALPPGWRIEVPSNNPTPTNPRDGIYVRFVPTPEWGHGRHVLGTATSYPGRSDRLIEVQQILDSRQAVSTLAHELMHTLGFGHVSIGPESLMEEAGIGHYINILHGIDREALRVLYGRLEGDDWPVDFGPWSSTSTHLHGNSPYAGFGVALRNGYVEPWAYGVEPFLREIRQVTVTLPDGTQRTEGNLANWPTDLADNHNLMGYVTWTGHLLGFSEENPVAGDASIGVNLGTMNGRVDFTNLEAWIAGQLPEDAGTGATWGDGDLGYFIAVQGNTFKQTGGDEGVVTGIFTGESHRGAAGTLERPDLTAAFGASR